MSFGDLLGSLTGNAASITNPTDATGSVVVSVGDLIFGVIGEQTGLTNSGCTDNLGNSYSAQNVGTNDTTTTSGRAWYTRVTVAGTLTAVHFAATASTNNVAVFVACFKGPFVVAPIDANPANGKDLTSPFACPATGTLSQARELVVAWGVANGSTVWAATSPNTLVGQATTATVLHTVIGYQVVNATTTVTPNFTAASNPTTEVLGTASFKQQVITRLGGKGHDVGLVLHAPMNEGVGLTAHDVSGNLNHGTLTNSPTWVRDPRFGNVIKTTSAAFSYVNFGDIQDANFVTTDSFSILIWAKYEGAQFTASQSTTTLTVSAISAGAIRIGMPIQTTGGASACTVTAFGTGTGGTGTYTVSTSATVSSTTWIGGYVQFNPICSKFLTSGNFTGWEMYLDLGTNPGGQGGIKIIDTAGTNALATTPVMPNPTKQTGFWHLWAGVVDRTAQLCKLSFDGLPFGTADCSLVGSLANTATVQVANQNGQDGIFHDFRIYKRALSLAEINAIYNGQRYNPRTPFKTNAGRWNARLAGATLNASITENASASDTPTATATFRPSINNSASASATPTATATFRPSINNSASASDTPTAVATYHISESDSANASATPTATATYHISESDSASASATPTATATYHVSESDSASASATPTAIATYHISESDSAGATATPTATATYHISESDSASASATPTATATFAASITENGSASSTQDAHFLFSVSVTETASASDSSSCITVLLVSETENASASSTQTATATFTPAITENASASASASTTATFRPSISETGSASATPTAIATYHISDSEIGSASSTQSAADTHPASITETGSASSTQSASFATTVNENDSTTASSTQSAVKVLNASISEVATATDTPSAIATYHVSESDAGSANASTSAIATYQVSETDTASASSISSTIATLRAVVNEATSASSTQTGHSIYPVSITETGSASAQNTAVIRYVVSTTASTSATDTLSAIVEKVVNEVAAAVSSQTVTAIFAPGIIAKANAIDIITAQQIFQKVPVPGAVAFAALRNLNALKHPITQAIAAPRTRVVQSELPNEPRPGWGVNSLTMSRAADFSPPIDATLETEFLLFDFGKVLSTGVVINSATVTCAVSRGTDANASTRVHGSPVIVPSQSTGVPASGVIQLVGGMIGGVVYLMQCVVNTSDGQALSLWSRLACDTPS